MNIVLSDFYFFFQYYFPVILIKMFTFVNLIFSIVIIQYNHEECNYNTTNVKGWSAGGDLGSKVEPE